MRFGCAGKLQATVHGQTAKPCPRHCLVYSESLLAFEVFNKLRRPICQSATRGIDSGFYKLDVD